MLSFGHLALRETFNRRLLMTVLLITFSQFNFGFDQQGYSTTQAMDPFVRQFGTYDTAQKKFVLQTKWLSYFNGFMYLGQATGTIVGSVISRRYGRRMCMFTMSIWAIVSATLAITSKSPNQILVARVLNYIYIGMELAVVPIFQSEITPKKSRGFVVATYQISLYLGSLLMNCIARGTSTLKTNAAWQIPYGLFYFVPTVVASLIWFVPESPRWLIMSDRYEDAYKALRQLREGKFTDEEIQGELDMIADGIRHEPEQGLLKEIFRGPNLRRSWIVVGANVCMQATGNQFTSIYGATFAKSLGTVNPFNVTIAIAVVNVCTAFLAMTLLDRFGRRVMILIGATIQVAALMTMGGLGTAAQQTFAIKSGVVAMMVIFNHGYSLGWAPAMHILSAEIPNTRCRDMTYRCASVLNIATQFAVTFSIPYLLNAPYANLKSKVGFIFGSTTAVSIIFAYFCVPNCHGRSLEEVNWLFENRTPTRHFGRTKIDLQEEATIRVQAKNEDAERTELTGNSKQV